ncbi:MAG: hypothetical protein ABIN58_01155 [candidate division WOR-3 bacterium]
MRYLAPLFQVIIISTATFVGCSHYGIMSDSGQADGDNTDGAWIPEPMPFEKYCIVGMIDDANMMCMFMSSTYVDGKWQCCAPLIHPGSSDYAFGWWERNCNLCTHQRMPWEEICLSESPLADPCIFGVSYCNGLCADGKHPAPDDFENWKRECLSNCEWQYVISEFP